MSERMKARIAVWLMDRAKGLLGVEPKESCDHDTCIHCGASGCESGTAEHAADCPMLTGVSPVTLRDMWPNGPACCDRCGMVFWPGEKTAAIPCESPLPGVPAFELACVGCAVLAGINEEGSDV